jgi:hypothetical protein
MFYGGPMSDSKEIFQFLLDGYPDTDGLVAEALSGSTVAGIDALSDQEIIGMMSALSRFVTFLQLKLNRLRADVIQMRRFVKNAEYKTFSKLDKVTDRTPSNLLMSHAYEENSGLEELHNDLASKESWAECFVGLPDRLESYINILKYELRRRENGRQ